MTTTPDSRLPVIDHSRITSLHAHRHIAQRILISIIQQYGREATEVLREWAEALEALGAEAKREVEFFAGLRSEYPTDPGLGS